MRSDTKSYTYYYSEVEGVSRDMGLIIQGLMSHTTMCYMCFCASAGRVFLI